MENEIKVGEYGRTNLGNIIKFAWFQNSETGETYKNKVILVDKMMTETYPFYYFEKDEYIVKHSSNLIDIIEENDIGIMNCYGLIVKKCLTMDDIFGLKTKEYELLELVTKEQFESISYKVERNNIC